jgi:Arm DNA-binding domain
MHQNSIGARMLTEADIQAIKPVRYARKVWDGRGLYLLVTPKGSLCWRYAYRFAGKHKKLSLGTYPVITIAWARLRHEFAQNLLADGVDPAVLKASIGRQAFAAKMLDWEIAEGHLSVLPLEVAEAIRVLHCELAR